MEIDTSKKITMLEIDGDVMQGYTPPNLQEKVATENGYVTADEGYDGLSGVEVNVASSGGGSGDKLKALVEGTITELTAEDLQGVTKIRNYAFHSSTVEKVTLPSSIETLDNHAFTNASVKEIVFNDGLKEIKDYAFQSTTANRMMANMLTLTFPSTLTFIGSNAFRYCDLSNISEIIIPDSVTSIGTYVFANCYIEDCNFVFGSGITTIPYSLFYNATNASSNIDSCKQYVTFRGDVKSISNNAFVGLNGVRLFDFRNCTSVPTMSGKYGLSDRASNWWWFRVVVPDELYDTWITATNWSTYASHIVKASEYTG